MALILMFLLGIFVIWLTEHSYNKTKENEKEIIEKMLETYNLELKNGVPTEKSVVYLKIKNYISF